jgi:MFS family permease
MPAPASPPKARFALWVSLWSMFVSNITLTVLTVALPYIARDLKADPTLVNWVSLGPMLVVALFTPATGRAADTFGRKRMWLLGLGLSLLGMAASAVSPSIWPLLLARVMTAVGTALLMPAALAITTDLYPPEQRATPIGYWTSVMAISPLAGVLLGGALLDVLSWRWMFVGQVALGLPALIAAHLGFDEQKFPAPGRFDWQGSIAIGLAALALVLATTWLGHAHTHALHAVLALAVCVAATVCAVRIERRAEQPVVPPWLIAEPVVSLSLIARFALTFSYMGAFMILPYLLKELWQMSALAISGVLIWRPLAMGLAGPVAGAWSPRFGATRLVVWGGYFILFSSAAFLWLEAQPNQALLILGLAVAGVGLGLSSPGSVAVVTERVGSELLGTVSSLMTLNATLANALGMAFMFAVVEAKGGIHSPAAYHASFWVGTLVSALGVLSAHALHAQARRVRPLAMHAAQVSSR